MNSTFGIGIVGAGVICADHLAALGALGSRVRLIGLAELDADKRSAAIQGTFIPIAVADYHELLNREDVQVIIVCTPPCTHEQIACDALRAGKHVLCEKPLAPTLAAIDRIKACAEGVAGRLSTVFQLRWGPEMQRAIHLRDRGCLGALIRGYVVRATKPESSPSMTSGWWGRWSVAGGGMVMTRFIHQLDQLRQVFGEPTSVSAIIDTLKMPIESEDTFSATIHFACGAEVTCSATCVAEVAESRFEIVGADASLSIPWKVVARDARVSDRIEAELGAEFEALDEGSLSKLQRIKRKVKKLLGRVPQPRRRQTIFGNLHAQQIGAFLDAIERNEPTPVPVDDARCTVELVTAIYTSGLTGTSITLPLDANTPFYDGVTAEDYAHRSTEAMSSGGHS